MTPGKLPPNTKKVVHYDPSIKPVVVVGCPTILVPIDHPDDVNVTNTRPARTSDVIAYDERTGRIETMNTIYLPTP